MLARPNDLPRPRGSVSSDMVLVQDFQSSRKEMLQHESINGKDNEISFADDLTSSQKTCLLDGKLDTCKEDMTFPRGLDPFTQDSTPSPKT